jgi:serine/threonine-protein kinase
MAPEQATGSVELIGPPTDVWAFGLVAFKLLVGKDFWGSQNLQGLYAKILAEPIPRPSERGSTLGAAFDAWFARCVAREIGERFRTTGEAAGALAEALGIRIERPRFSSASFPAAVPVESSVSIVLPPSAVNAEPTPAVSNLPSGGGARTKTTLLVVAGAVGLLLVAGAAVAVERATRKPEGSARGAGEGMGIVASPSQGTAPSVAAPVSPRLAESASVSASPLAEAPASPLEAPSVATTTTADTARARGGGGGAVTKPSATTTAAPAPATGAAGPDRAMNKEQRRRLDALQRLCDQGTFTPAECKAKRGAILRGEQ